MNSQLRGFAAWAALVAGVLFVLAEIGFVFAAAGDEFIVEGTALYLAAAVLLLLAAGLSVPGLLGIHARHAHRTGLLGPAAAIVLGAGLVLLTGLAWTTAFVHPHLADTAPNLLLDGAGAPAAGTTATGYAMLVGTVLFAVVTWRARVYSPLVAGALALGGVTLVFGDRIPVFTDTSTLLLGFAFVGYGLELRDDVRDADAAAEAAPPDPVLVEPEDS